MGIAVNRKDPRTQTGYAWCSASPLQLSVVSAYPSRRNCLLVRASRGGGAVGEKASGNLETAIILGGEPPERISMALLGFDKSKALKAAEKYVLQGKLSNAIDEYNKILKRDPKDLMTLNTIGDLYDRDGKREEALKCFYDLAEKSVEAGFIPRAIAVYKRVTKLDSESIPPLLKLGELFSMQGLLRDARTHYLQAVELHMRRGEKDQAREVFEKVLLLDLENPKLQLRMAQLYAETGKQAEAVTTYLGAIERFLDLNEQGDASRGIEELERLDPKNEEGKVLRGRMYVEQGNFDRAIQTLQSIPSPAGNKGALNWLFHAYMKQGDAAKARDIATQLLDLHSDFAGLGQICEQLLENGQAEEALGIYEKAWEHPAAQESSGAIADGLKKILTSHPSHPGVLDLLWQVYQRAGNRGEAQEIGEALAHLYVTDGEIERAREICAELVEMAPENPEFRQLLRQVDSRLPGGSPAMTEGPEPLAAMDFGGDEPAAPQGTLSPREEEIIRNSVTESDLYVTYRQFSQAIEVLENALAEVPGNITLLEHLLQVCDHSGDYRKAATCAESLTEAYVMLGDGDRATQYGELTVSLQQKAARAERPAVEKAPPIAEPKAAAAEPAPPEPQVREVDLSMEWAALSGSDAAAAAAPSGADSIAEEIEFYLQASLASDAETALSKLRAEFPSHPSLADFEARLATLQGEAAPVAETAQPKEAVIQGAGPAPPVEEPQPTDVPVMEEAPSWEEPQAVEPPAEEAVPPPMPEAESPPPARPVEPARAPAAQEQDLVLEDMLAPTGSSPGQEAFELSLDVPAAPSRTGAARQDKFADLAEALGDMLGETSLPPKAAAPPPPPRPAAASAPPQAAASGPASGGLLDDVFAEFRDEMEEPAGGGGDIETHYNMGIAFKEMALYDEAIGEFQKAHQLAEQAKDTSNLVQCCTLLATCFIEKGLPLLAVRWYQTALSAPGLDPESSMALLYETGSAYEMAGDKAAALKSFMEVYARNIDYRNVSDRIRDLQ